jgi:outer membrane protein OmpA-like peptidoglycan-associated protein
MPENERLPAAGAQRLFDALKAVPYFDADTDEDLDLFVCDLLSEADKIKFEERIRQDPRLADEVQQRKADLDADLSTEQPNELMNPVAGPPARVPSPQPILVPKQFSPDRRIRQPVIETRSVSSEGWKLPAWFLMAAAFVGLAGIAVIIVNHSANHQELARDKVPNVSNPPTSPNSADIARLAGFETLLTKPEITESAVRIMGDQNPEIDRKYDGHILSITYFDHTKKTLPFVLLPVLFEKGTAKVVDEVSRAHIFHLADFLKNFGSPDFQITIEVHARTAAASETDKALLLSRAATLRSLLEAQGVPSSEIWEAKVVDADEHQVFLLPDAVQNFDATQPFVLIIRSR